jgi:hypothetical protein
VELASLEALLKPASMDMGAPGRDPCLPGTRVEILRDLFTSLIDPNLSDNVIWIRGEAGCGKSSLLNTIARHFSELGRCGAFLFWNRNDETNSDPLHVIRTLAFKLAQSNAAFSSELASRIADFPNSVTSSFDEQFRRLVQEPLATVEARDYLGPIIIVLDGFDECGTPKTKETRKRLIDTLSVGLTELPKTFRFLIASRDEPDIHEALSRRGISIRDVPVGDDSTISDITLFLQLRLSSIANARKLGSDWPGDQKRGLLVTLSGGLFIWVSTAVRYIESAFPDVRLKKVLDSSASGRSHDRLGNLYQVALANSFDHCEADELEAAHSILGAIVVAREQLTDEQLSRLSDRELSLVQEVLLRLRPLLRGGDGKPIQVLHTSFIDFLCDAKRCQDIRWHIDSSTHHHNLASGCLLVMGQDLRFNICDVETSYYPHRQIEGIQARIDKAITPSLMYASRYWADHLELVSSAESVSHQLAGKVTGFMKSRLLYWIEVFSLKGQMSTTSVILRSAAAWAKVSYFDRIALVSIELFF